MTFAQKMDSNNPSANDPFIGDDEIKGSISIDDSVIATNECDCVQEREDAQLAAQQEIARVDNKILYLERFSMRCTS